MHDASPTITLLIPTRERAETLAYTLRTAVRQESTSYEIVVCDNFSRDHTRDVVHDVRDPRIRYVNPGRRLSMSDNWEYALEQARGRYVILIGDDDALLPGAIDRLEPILRDTPYLACRWETTIYLWPIDDAKARVMSLAIVQADRVIDLRAAARFVIAYGGWRHWTLSGIYHAAVSRSLLDSIRARTGRVFHTTVPDIFAMMAVPAFTDQALAIGHPVSIVGRSAKSNGGSPIARDGPAVLSQYIQEFGDYAFHPTLYPGIRNFANWVVDAFLVAMDKFPEYYGGLRFNYSAMWAFMCRLDLITWREVLRLRHDIRCYHPFSATRFLYYWALHRLTLLRHAIRNRATSLGPFEKDVPSNIDDFAQALSAWQR